MTKQFIRLPLLILLGSLATLSAIRAESQEIYTPILSFELESFFAFLDTTLRIDSSLKTKFLSSGSHILDIL
ncbi:MAG: hypothetical protein PVH84_03515 [Candidatus Aminicenantes bacterium]|jgi:hypothetical protein